ncbi:MAG: di-trans,poly-cis-decaprenylcistransferase [Spirochaetales bacterium]|nr:di-trans,poly-cis-decaprenylcistransferase [Spirochaetales bacterium]MCF7937478.1 di-trans,poly-cis-decaprenylcistransferase [Spirochaetales bacterium]
MPSSSVPRERIPRHVGIIMDGNGRWAKQRSRPRTSGHDEGLQTAKKIIKAASDAGVSYLSLYTFSTENWKRAEDEVSFLMGLIKKHLKREYEFYRENRIRVVHSGDLERLPVDVQSEISQVMHDTRDYPGIVVNLAINYGGRDEIIRAFNRWLSRSDLPSQTGNNNNSGRITEENFREFLDLPFFPDPDLIIRTAGEQRVSNFLLWQAAYSEFYYSDKLWPDWQPEDLNQALAVYADRERKFGGVK